MNATIRTLPAVLSSLLCLSTALAEPPRITDPVDREIFAAFLEHVEKSAAQCTPERMAQFASQPEDIVWQASKYIRMPLVAYQLTGDRKHLDQFVERMDALCGCLEKGADGLLNWYGKPLDLFRHPDHPDQKTACELTSFEMSGLIAEFAGVVRKDAALTSRYRDAVRRYLSLAEDHLVKKWEPCWRDLGATGGVYISEPELKPVKASLTQPHNKQAKIVAALVGLYIITGKDEYLARAIKLGTRFKHCLTRAGDRYQWNYWDPAGPWDVDPQDHAKWKHWIGAEHRGGYYSMSLSQAVLLYEYGLVFDREDVDRFVATQVTVCWNGDLKAPKWRRVDGRPADAPYLCPALAPFDKRIGELAFGASAQQERIKNKTHSWQGAVVACDWLELKYLVCPRWSGGEPAEKAAIAAFVAKPGNQALIKSLAFRVAAPDYQPPATPAEMGLKGS